MQKKLTTVKDVARESGVSVTAVSLVLNGRASNISQKTKEKILQKAKELDYQPDATARSLATKKSNTIGVIIPDISNAFFAETVRNIQIELNEYGYDMFLCNSEEKFSNDIKYIKLFNSRNVDGLIITMSAETMGNGNQHEIKKLLEKCRIPYVLFDRFYEGSESRVYVDNLKSGYEVAKYLLECGHKDIGVITGPLNLNSSRDRLDGVRKALKEYNIELKEENIINGKYDIESGKEGAKKLLGQVTAIFAFNDLQAYGVIEMARKTKVSIPNDVSLVGFDDIFYSTVLDTRLTTVRQPILDMSKKICQTLMEIIEEPTKTAIIPMEAKLIIRDSVKNIRMMEKNVKESERVSLSKD